MVKATGPLQSAKASGQLAASLIFTKSKRGTNLKSYAKPRQPRTPGQITTRAMCRFLAKAWQHLSTDNHATWIPLSQESNLSPYHAYLKHNATRWVNDRCPTQAYPAAEILGPLVGGHFRAYGGRQYAWTETANGPIDTHWGSIIHRSTSHHFVANHLTVIGAILRGPTTPTKFKDTPLEPGTYYYRSDRFTLDGVHGIISYDWTVIVT